MEKVIRAFRPVGESFFLLGPRGTGKSTLIKDFFPKALYVDLLLPDVFRAFLSHPERLRELAAANRDKKEIVIDEVQKVPEILEVVHSMMEEKQGWQFILTGSSARKLKKSGTDMLAGRALMRKMHPFIASELKSRFDLERSMQEGMVPVVLDSSNPIDALQAYVNLYLREEVQQEGLTRNMGNFARFLEAVSFSHASILTVSNVARECAVERKVVEGYLHILEDLLLSFRLPVFTRRAKRVTTQHPKFYFFDTGVFNALRPSGPLDRTEERMGQALEGLVAQHLRAWIDYRHATADLYYWRTSAGTEVDFVVYGKDLFWAIEVKNSARIQPRDLKPLKTFGEDYPESERFLLYRGREKLLRSGITIQHCQDFLLALT